MRASLTFAALLTLLCFINAVHAEPVFTIKPVTYHLKHTYGDAKKISVPMLVMNDKEVEARINTTLTLSLLGMVPLSKEEAAKTRVLSSSIDGIFIERPKLARAGRVVSFSFSKSCGHHCEVISDTLNFDAHTGRVFALTDILSAQGWEALHQRITKINIQRLNSAIAQTNRPNEHRSEDEQLTQKEFYKECLKSIKQSGSSVARFDFNEKGLSFEYHACSFPHAIRPLDAAMAPPAYPPIPNAIRALDDSETSPIHFSNEALRPYLSDYGQYILFGEGEETARTALSPLSSVAQVFRGKIDQSTELTLLLSNSVAPAYATYLYKKTLRPIEANISYKKQEITLNQAVKTIEVTNKEGEKTLKEVYLNEVFTFRMEGSKLIGQWQGMVGGKTVRLPFEAEAF